MDVVYTDRALDDLKGLQKSDRRRVVAKVAGLAETPVPARAKKLKGDWAHLADVVYRVRCGDYRILYSVSHDAGEVLVLTIGNRKNVYR